MIIALQLLVYMYQWQVPYGCIISLVSTIHWFDFHFSTYVFCVV